MTETDRFRHDRSAYERPNFPYVCGRAAAWGKPCGRGPNIDGSCGGTTACTPFFKDGRWECRRPGTAGGPCSEGPLPDGGCSQSQPPCIPRMSLRRVRGRIALFAAAVVVAFLAAFIPITEDGAAGLSSRTPGPLSGDHANFANDCGTCHEAHREDGMGWGMALFADNDMTGACGECHGFDGPATAPHNTLFVERDDLGPVACADCHTEHKGADFNIAAMSDAQCNSCHLETFESLGRGHPAFGATYPYDRRTSIQFDHAAHLSKHFVDPRNADKAPNGCVGCHDVDNAGRDVRPVAFEAACAQCHDSQIRERPLVLIKWPELSEDGLRQLKRQNDDVLRACGINENNADWEYAVSADYPALVHAYLSRVDGDDPEAYSPALVSQVLELAAEGKAPLAAAIAEGLGLEEEEARALLAGLSPELVQRAACAWAANMEYEPLEGQDQGWYAEYLTLGYRPAGHQDPVARRWLALIAGGASGPEAADEDQALAADQRQALQEAWLAADGPGACIKCHSVTEGAAKGGAVTKVTENGENTPNNESNDENMLTIAWHYGATRSDLHTVYRHGPHINLLGPDASCGDCHALNEAADYGAAFKTWSEGDFESNFQPITVETCASCHDEGKVRDDCQLCHRYHREPMFKERMMRQ